MRYKILEINGLMLVDLFKKSITNFQVVENIIPLDSKFITAYTNMVGHVGKLAIIIESSEFSDIPDGMPYPKIEYPIIFHDVKL